MGRTDDPLGLHSIPAWHSSIPAHSDDRGGFAGRRSGYAEDRLEDDMKGSRDRDDARRLIVDACRALQRPDSEADRLINKLEAEWLDNIHALRRLKPADWRRLSLPTGLERELQRRLGSRVSEASAAPAARAASRHSSAPASKRQYGYQPPARTPSVPQRTMGVPCWKERRRPAELDEVCSMLRRKIGYKWPLTLISVLRHRRIDVDSLRAALLNLKVENLTKAQAQKIFRWVAPAGADATAETVVAGLYGPLTAARTTAVQDSFLSLTDRRVNRLPVNELKRRCDVLQHPAVIKGLVSAEEASNSLFGPWRLTSTISIDDFMVAHVPISALVSPGDDDGFEKIVQKLWRVQEQAADLRPNFNRDARDREQRNDRNVNTNRHSDDEWRDLEDPPVSRPRQRDLNRSRLEEGFRGEFDEPPIFRPRARDISRSRFGDGVLDFDESGRRGMPERGMLLERPRQSRSFEGLEESSWKEEQRAVAESNIRRHRHTREGLEKLRIALKRRNSYDTLQKLATAFRIAGGSQGGRINVEELCRALQHVDVGISRQDVSDLFYAMDVDQDGSIDFEEWLCVIRGPMNAGRLATVREVFNNLDLNGDGVVDISEIGQHYNARRHPDVESGRKTEKDVLKAFLYNIGDTDRNQRLTWDEFVKYYEGVSASINSDQYFIQVVTSAWGLDDTHPNIQYAKNRQRAYEGHIIVTEGGLAF